MTSPTQSARAARKAAASQRRTDWKLSWTEQCRKYYQEEIKSASITAAMEKSLYRLLADKEKLQKQNPTQSSEIERAFMEFLNHFSVAALAAAAATTAAFNSGLFATTA